MNRIDYNCCAYCGRKFRYGYSGFGMAGGGYCRQYLVKLIDGIVRRVCSDRCGQRFVEWSWWRVGRTPRAIGRETVQEVLS